MIFLFIFATTKVSFQAKIISMELGIIYFCRFLFFCLIYPLKNNNMTFLKNTHWDFSFFLNDPWHFSFWMLVRFPSVNSKKQARENSTMASISSRMKECQRACLGVQSVQRRDSKLLLPIYIPLLCSEAQGTELCLPRAASYAYLSQYSKYRDLNKTKHWKKVYPSNNIKIRDTKDLTTEQLMKDLRCNLTFWWRSQD